MRASRASPAANSPPACCTSPSARSQTVTLTAQADTARAEADVQEALALEQREAQDAYLALAQGLYADEQQLLADAEAADLTDEADAAHAAALAAEASAAQAEQLSIAATQQALDLSGQASALDAQAAGETLLAQAAQAQADYYADLAANPPSTFEQTLFVYDLSGHLIGEYGVDGSTKVEHAWLEDMPLAQLRDDGSLLGGTTVYWFHADHVNTPTTLTDESRQVVWDAVREPFGKTEAVTSTVTNNLRIPGQYQDAETGLHYNYFRDYDPSLGRYVESDPIGLDGGINVYSYALSNPTNSSDPSGQNPVAVVAAYCRINPSACAAAAAATAAALRNALNPPGNPPASGGGDSDCGDDDDCQREIAECERLCRQAQGDPDLRNVWGGGFWPCMLGCVSWRCMDNL